MERRRKRHVIKWEWVKGHSGDTWNERADKLADEGREMSTSPAEAPQERERKPKPKGNPPGELRTVGGVRGVIIRSQRNEEGETKPDAVGMPQQESHTANNTPRRHRNPRKEGKRGDNWRTGEGG